MINIVICDDNNILLDDIRVRIFNISTKLKKEINIYKFTEGQNLINKFNMDNEAFDIVFLDIEMPGINGFEVAENLRKNNSKVIIIFLTSMESLVFDSFRYAPLRFIRKKQLDFELEESLVKAFNELERNSRFYIFKTSNGEIKLLLDDILYIESSMRKIYIHTAAEIYQLVGGQFNELVDELKKNGFILTHRTCLINVKCIYSIEAKNVVLDNKEKLPISRYRVKEVKEAFIKLVE